MTDPTEFQDLATAAEVRESGIRLVADARRTVHIWSRDMDPALYDDSAFLEALTRFLTSHPRAHARLMVVDATPAIRNGHRLIDLSQRLSSRLEIREPAQQHRDYNAAFLVTDSRGVLYRELGDRYEALFSEDARARARQLIRFHTEAWEFGHHNPSLRALGI